MTNAEIAGRLEEVASLLELEEASFFRVQAYRNAAEVVRDLPGPVADRVAAGGDLTELEHIGRDLARAIEALVHGEPVPVLASLEAPASLLELLRVSGIGPKRARRLWRELGVTDLAALEAALEAGLVAALPGFGPATEQSLRSRVARLRQR